MDENLINIQEQLEKRCFYPVIWNFRFHPSWEPDIQFVYSCATFEEVLQQSESLRRDIQHYAINRWYNFWSQKALNEIFASHPEVQAVNNSAKNLIRINGDVYQVKSLVYPNQFARTLRYALQHEQEMVQWLCRKFSRNNHDHSEHQLFLLLFQRDGEHWKLKAKLTDLMAIVHEYLDNFNKNGMCQNQISRENGCKCGLIWFINNE
ncbi:MAG: hypothetical protein WAN36_14240 [Calditrichia bacterium]